MAKYVVRYGTMRNLGVMTPKGGDQYKRSDQVIARTSRGLEVGEVLCEATEQATEGIDEANSGQIIRCLETDDFTELGRIGSSRSERFEKSQSHIDALNLDMELVDIEQLFGGERIVIYYLAEQRVDFRELVKNLAAEFQTRIEMRQIGVRDEAKLLADYGDCGKPVCCNTHLSSMPPVSMKMAKIQKATLDPNKISGRCGRLKCCLRYEYDTYLALQKEAPKVGVDVVTRDGRGRVIGQEILAEQVLLEMEDHRRVLVDLKDILSVISKKPAGKNAKQGVKGGDGQTGSGDAKSSEGDSSRKTDGKADGEATGTKRSKGERGKGDSSRRGNTERPRSGDSRQAGGTSRRSKGQGGRQSRPARDDSSDRQPVASDTDDQNQPLVDEKMESGGKPVDSDRRESEEKGDSPPTNNNSTEGNADSADPDSETNLH